MDLCSSSTTTQRPRHAKMDSRFREIYSRALDPPRFFPWASRARLDNYSWTGFRWKPTLLARRRGGNTVGVGREKLGNMPRANIIGRATLSHGWTFNQRPSDDDAPVPRSWGHVPLSGTCIVHRSVWFHRKTVSFHRLQHPPPLCTFHPELRPSARFIAPPYLRPAPNTPLSHWWHNRRTVAFLLLPLPSPFRLFLRLAKIFSIPWETLIAQWRYN